MGDVIKKFVGGGADISDQQRKDAAKAERRALAAAAQQQAELDQAGSKRSRKSGNRLLTFLSGDGQSTLG